MHHKWFNVQRIAVPFVQQIEFGAPHETFGGMVLVRLKKTEGSGPHSSQASLVLKIFR